MNTYERKLGSINTRGSKQENKIKQFKEQLAKDGGKFGEYAKKVDGLINEIKESNNKFSKQAISSDQLVKLVEGINIKFEGIKEEFEDMFFKGIKGTDKDINYNLENLKKQIQNSEEFTEHCKVRNKELIAYKEELSKLYLKKIYQIFNKIKQKYFYCLNRRIKN